MELHQVRYFVALARSLNFTRAAEQCEVTQPALTKAIQKLEQELGGPLIHRERQLTQLTDLGKIILPMVERTLAAADSVRRQALEFQRHDLAPLRVALAPCVSAALVTQAFSEISNVIPGLRVEMLEAPADELPDLLLDGRAHAAIAGDFPALPNRIDHWRLFGERYVVLASERNPLAHQASVSSQALADAIWLERIGCRVWPRFLEAHFPKSHEPTIAHRAHDENHLQHMAAADLGVMLAPEHAPYLPALVACPIAGTPLQRDVHLLVVSGRRYPPALAAFIKTSRLRDWRTGFPRASAVVVDMRPTDRPAARLAPLAYDEGYLAICS